jgi:hypothetical protein
MRKSRVFVSQQTLRKSNATGEMYQFPSLRPAEVYGEVVFLLDFNEAMDLSEPEMMWTIRRRIAGFSDSDYVLPLGSPEAMALSLSLAAEVNDGRVRMLRYLRDSNSYEVRCHDLNAQPIRNGEMG